MHILFESDQFNQFFLCVFTKLAKNLDKNWSNWSVFVFFEENVAKNWSNWSVLVFFRETIEKNWLNWYLLVFLPLIDLLTTTIKAEVAKFFRKPRNTSLTSFFLCVFIKLAKNLNKNLSNWSVYMKAKETLLKLLRFEESIEKIPNSSVSKKA